MSDPRLTEMRALRAVALQFFANGAIFASFAPRLPEIRDRIDVDLTTVGLILSVGAAFGLLGSASVSTAIERIGTRAVVLGGGVLLALSLAGIGLAATPIAVVVALAAMNVFDVMVDVGMNMQGSWLSARRARPVMNRLHGLWSLGTVLGGLTTAAVSAAGVSVRTHLLVAAAVLLGVMGVVGRGLLRDDEAAVPGPEQAPAGRLRRLLSGGLGIVFLLGFAALVMEGAPYDWAAFRLRDDLGTSAPVAVLGYVAVTCGMTVGRFAGDHAVNAFGAARVRRTSIALVLAGLVLATVIPDVTVIVVGFALVGLGNATLLPDLYDRAARWPGARGAALGALTAGNRIAVLLAPLVVGGLAGGTMSVGGMSVGGALAVVALPATLLFWLLSARLPAAATPQRDSSQPHGDDPQRGQPSA